MQKDQPTFPEVKIHESAYVDAPCKIGKGTRIWHFTHVMPNCEIGENVNIGQNVVVSPDVRIGKGCKIQNNVSLYTGVILEDYVFCGPSMVFTNVNTPRSEINRRSEYSTTLIKRGASLGANSTIVCGTTVGRYAFVAAGAVVTKDVPDYAMMMGVPARRRGWACRCGEPTGAPGANGEITCKQCGNQYREVDGRLTVVKETQVVP
ncbi:MAG: acyltransferase [Phycisphaerales bacterium]|nr:N-acetyltransferase [Planctomycetota bacterium]